VLKTKENDIIPSPKEASIDAFRERTAEKERRSDSNPRQNRAFTGHPEQQTAEEGDQKRRRGAQNEDESLVFDEEETENRFGLECQAAGEGAEEGDAQNG